MTNLILHDIEVPRIRHQNSLNRPLSDYSAKDRVDVIVTNPPFGGAEDAAVKQNFPSEFQTSETADLFMALIMNLLKDRGRCGVVLPDGFMFGDGVKATIKEKLLKEYGLHTIIRLPQVFKPYASVNTNLLFFQKGITSRGVWFYRLDYPEGVKSFTKTKPMQDHHFDPVREWWTDKQPIVVDGFDKARFYTVEELRDLNYDFDKCCPFPHVEEEILEPKDLIARYQAERTELEGALDRIMQNVLHVLNSEEAPQFNRIDNISSRLITLQKDFPDKLRKSVLQQAIQGKLTDRDPADEPVAELLKRIRAEKERLIKEGKIKKEKNLPPITEEEIPFEIPDGWVWVRLQQIVFNREQETPTERFSYIDIGSIDNQHQCLNAKETLIDPENAPSRARKLVEIGDILYSTVRPYLHNMCIIDRGFSYKPIASTGFAVMACCSGVYNKYLFYYLLSPAFDNYANDTAKGAAYPAINDNQLYRALIPLPPLAEQQRIVDRVNELLAVCDELK